MHRYIQALCAAVFLAISRRSVFEFHLSVTKECVFHSPTPAPPETAAGSHKNSILWCIFQLLSSEKLPFFLFSIFHRVLQRRLCSHDIDTRKCLAGKLLDPFFSPSFLTSFQHFPDQWLGFELCDIKHQMGIKDCTEKITLQLSQVSHTWV